MVNNPNSAASRDRSGAANHIDVAEQLTPRGAGRTGTLPAFHRNRKSPKLKVFAT